MAVGPGRPDQGEGEHMTLIIIITMIIIIFTIMIIIILYYLVYYSFIQSYYSFLPSRHWIPRDQRHQIMLK